MPDERALAVLAKLLGAHGVPNVREGEWVVPHEAGFPPAGAQFTFATRPGQGATCRMDVAVPIEDGNHLVESFVGIGDDPEAAIASAVQYFAAGSLHVLLAAFWGRTDEEQVAVEEWRLEGIPYRAVLGNFVPRTAGADAPLPDALFGTLERLITGLPASEALYWVRLFHGRVPGAAPVTEVLLNGASWEAADGAVAALPWEPRDHFYSVRLFLVLQRLG
ncbi:MAG: hypothetical protein JO306_17325 [Gemmatimonadetes bacterium]|nr:hypothetical protein [Gemmatimonadota bacterium]